ncbi:MAG: hypothetical protein ACI4OA_00460 [Selenomonadaceae bacterium]
MFIGLCLIMLGVGCFWLYRRERRSRSVGASIMSGTHDRVQTQKAAQGNDNIAPLVGAAAIGAGIGYMAGHHGHSDNANIHSETTNYICHDDYISDNIDYNYDYDRCDDDSYITHDDYENDEYDSSDYDDYNDYDDDYDN